MKTLKSGQVRSAILAMFKDSLRANGLEPSDVPDGYDLLTQGIIDSLGMVAMVSMVEDLAGCEIDFEQLDFEDITVIEKFCDYVARYTADQSDTSS